jgi:SAM-dependent methyltransferase
VQAPKLRALAQRVLKQPMLKQGPHVDPLDPGDVREDPRAWGPARRDAFASREMEYFREALRLEDGDVRAGVLDDLSTFFELPPEECLRRCLHWEEMSVAEWQAGDRSSPEGLLDFYRSVTSWSFDLAWYCYLQAEGYAIPTSVMVARFLRTVGRTGGRHLDFGSGAGATAQLFGRLGYETALADISKPLLDFARFRLDRRGDTAAYLDLVSAELETEHYDVITALDTLVLVPDLGATARDLHRALRPGGWLFANVDDVRPSTDENAWHLYDDDLVMRWAVQRAGFEPRAVLDGITRCYQKVDPTGWRHHARGARDALVLRSPVRRHARRVRWPTRAGLTRRLRTRGRPRMTCSGVRS